MKRHARVCPSCGSIAITRVENKDVCGRCGETQRRMRFLYRGIPTAGDSYARIVPIGGAGIAYMKRKHTSSQDQ